MIGGKGLFIAKTYDECDNLLFMNSPAILGDWCEIHRVDTNILFIFSTRGNETIIYKSVDGGNNWIEKLHTDTIIGEHFAMFDSLQGILLCFQNEVMRTYDGGDTWNKDFTAMYYTTAIERHGDSTVCVGLSNNFGISHNRGNTWTFSNNGIVGTATYQRNIFFLSKDSILSVSVNPSGNSFMSYSTDGGINWICHEFPPAPYFDAYDLYFFNMNEGYIVGGGGRILKTTDTGNTWTIYETQIPYSFTRIEFLNDSIALIAGTNGTLIKWNKHSWATEVINTEKENNIQVYPNPSNGLQNIELINTKVEPFIIELFDVGGRKIADVYNGSSANGKMNINCDLSQLGSGIYHYKVQIGNQIKYLKTFKVNQ
jgi:photosystem II stability/assembly factor-like uncharacterized protein